MFRFRGIIITESPAEVGERLVVVTVINKISRDPCLVSLPLATVLHTCQKKVRVGGKRKRNTQMRDAVRVLLFSFPLEAVLVPTRFQISYPIEKGSLSW